MKLLVKKETNPVEDLQVSEKGFGMSNVLNDLIIKEAELSQLYNSAMVNAEGDEEVVSALKSLSDDIDGHITSLDNLALGADNDEANINHKVSFSESIDINEDTLYRTDEEDTSTCAIIEVSSYDFDGIKRSIESINGIKVKDKDSYGNPIEYYDFNRVNTLAIFKDDNSYSINEALSYMVRNKGSKKKMVSLRLKSDQLHMGKLLIMSFRVELINILSPDDYITPANSIRTYKRVNAGRCLNEVFIDGYTSQCLYGVNYEKNKKQISDYISRLLSAGLSVVQFANNIGSTVAIMHSYLPRGASDLSFHCGFGLLDDTYVLKELGFDYSVNKIKSAKNKYVSGQQGNS